MNCESNKKRLAILVSFSGDGGVERMVTHLIEGMVNRGIEPDVLLIRSEGHHVKQLPPQARLIPLRTGHTWLSLPEVYAYLRRRRPHAVLAVKERAIEVAALAMALPGGARCRLVGRLGTTLSAALKAQNRGSLKRRLRFAAIRRLFAKTDCLVAVSQGVADDFRRITGLPPEHFKVVRNPVITGRLTQLAAEPVDHPWFQAGAGIPLVLGVGRLTLQKDFELLIRAIAMVKQKRPARLMILGEGGQRPVLERLVQELGLHEDVILAGFARNPYAYMAKSNVFVLSSRWEGSPNVLTEAMALGVPVAATDCPSGPREVLRDGQWGPLAPVGDVPAMAAAIEKCLDAPVAGSDLRAAVADYHVENSTAAYLRALDWQLDG